MGIPRNAYVLGAGKLAQEAEIAGVATGPSFDTGAAQRTRLRPVIADESLKRYWT